MNYAEIEEDTIVNVAVCDDPAYAEEMGWLPLEDMDPMPWIGWTRDDAGVWTPPPEPE